VLPQTPARPTYNYAFMQPRHMTQSGDHPSVPGALVRIDFYSDVDMLPLVDALSQHIAETNGLDAESIHWLKVATREAVINAIVHGNGSDRRKQVHVEFASVGDSSRAAVSIRVRDEGLGFDPASVSDPLAEPNLLRPGGRGLLLMRSILDDVRFHCSPDGPTEVVLVKRAAAPAIT